MSRPNRPSISRRGFLAAMAAASATVGAVALSARGADAAAWPAVTPGEPLGSSAGASIQRADHTAQTARQHGERAIPARMASAAQDTAIRPCVVDVPEADIDDLRRRVAATRWTDRETVTDQSQGAPLDNMQALVRYWGTEYDWRKAEATLNALPQFTTNIDGVDIHFIHVRSRHPNALPVIITHGWPGSVFEFLRTIRIVAGDRRL